MLIALAQARAPFAAWSESLPQRSRDTLVGLSRLTAAARAELGAAAERPRITPRGRRTKERTRYLGCHSKAASFTRNAMRQCGMPKRMTHSPRRHPRRSGACPSPLNRPLSYGFPTEGDSATAKETLLLRIAITTYELDKQSKSFSWKYSGINASTQLFYPR